MDAGGQLHAQRGGVDRLESDGGLRRGDGVSRALEARTVKLTPQ
jgi:hypothetical protein